MKKGDKLYCKKTNKYFIENSFYEILSIFNISSSLEKDLYYNIRSERHINPYGNTDNSIVISQEDIDTHFYTKQEVRKIKLEKLKS